MPLPREDISMQPVPPRPVITIHLPRQLQAAAPKPPLSSKSLSEREDSAESSKFKCATFLLKVAVCLELLSRQQVPGAASSWCSGNPGKRGMSFTPSGVKNSWLWH